MKMWTSFLFSLGSLLGAVISFLTGLLVFGDRIEAIQARKEATGSETVYLGDALHANRAAETGSLIS